jgi:WD40 repeat protein
LDSSVLGLAFTPDGGEVYAYSLGLAVHWNVTTRKWVHPETAGGPVPQLHTTPSGIRALQPGGDSEAEETSENLVRVSDPLTDTVLHTVRWAEPKEVEFATLRAYRLTADGKTLLVLHSDKPAEGEVSTCVTACDVRSGRRLARFRVPGHTHSTQPPFSPCGRWVVLGEKVYHVGTGRELFTLTGEPGERLLPENQRAHSPVWFSEDGRLLAGLLTRKGDAKSVRPDTLAVWELASGKVLSRVSGARCVVQVAFAPDGRSLALLDGREVVVQDLLTGKPRVRYPAPDVPSSTLGVGCGSGTLVFAPDGRTLATGHHNGSIQLWRVPQAAEAGPKMLAPGECETLWIDLGSDAPGKARAAVERLIRHPDAGVTLLKARFRPAGPAPDERRISEHIEKLDSDGFATREEAERKLREIGARAEPALRQELAKTTSLERKLRIQRVLDSITPPFQALPLSGESLRGVRAIEVLERVGTAEARAILQAWSEQGGDLRLAAEARLALERGHAAKPTAGPAR